MKEKYKIVIKTLLMLLFIGISLTAMIAILLNKNELEFKHIVGLFMLAIAMRGVDRIIFD